MEQRAFYEVLESWFKMVGSYIEIKYKTKGGEIYYSTQEVLQYGYSEHYGCKVAVVDKDSPMYFSYPSGKLLLSLNYESQIAKARVTSWSVSHRDLYDAYYY
jgi:hypothetical protein